MLSRIQGTHLGWLLASIGAIAFFLQGYDQGLMNGLITLESFVNQFPQMDTTRTTGAQKSSNSTIQGTVVAIYEVGAALGALSCFLIGDWLGRRYTILCAACTVILGVILQATPFNIVQLAIGRVVTGLGVGAFTATVPMWVSECSRSRARGRLVMLEGSFAIGGVAFVNWFEFGLYYVRGSSVNWRLPIAFQSIFAIVVVLLILALPESPRWLIAKERFPEARTNLARLDGLTEDSKLIDEDMDLIRKSLAEELDGHSSNPFASTPNRHLQRTLTAITLNILAQMTGVNIITFYSNTIFENILGYDETTSRVISGCLNIWQFLCATSAIFLIDRFGRRRLLLVASFTMALSQAGLAGLQSHQENKSAAAASLLFYFIALCAFPIGLFLIPFMYAAEIAPLRIRARVTAMSTASNWIFNFLLAEITPIGFDSISWKYYLIYVCTSSLAFCFVYFFCPEVKGRSLEDVDEIFTDCTTIFDPVKKAKSLLPVSGRGEQLDEREEKQQYGEHVEDVSPQ